MSSTSGIAPAAWLALLICGCGSNPSSPTAGRLLATLSPNPLTAPTSIGEDVVWNVEFRADGTGSVLLERGHVRLVDASSRVVGLAEEFFSRSAGCNVCPDDMRLEDGRSMRFSNKRLRYVGGGVPVRLEYTVWYTDELGPGSTTTHVPVR